MLFSSSRGKARRAPRPRRASTIASRPLEVLDARQLLAAGPLGINLTPSLDFVDLMKEAPDFVPVSSSSTLTVDSKGWPTSDAAVLVLDERVNQAWNGPDPNVSPPDIGGTYHLSFQGQATVSPPGWLQIFTVQNQVYNAATNTTTADLSVVHNAYPFLELYFTNTVNPASSTGAGVTNVKLIQPGYAANTTQLFTNNAMNDLAPFTTLRYVNPEGVNNYGERLDASGNMILTNWSQRTLPDARSQTSSTNPTPGEAWEYMIALANATNTDMWINVPGTATDDYVQQLASLIKNGDTVDGVAYAGLNPNLKVYLEYSNEVWGGGYGVYDVNQEATKEELATGTSVLNNDGDTNQYDLQERRYVERTMQITNIFRSVIGSDPTYSQIRPILGAQEDNWQSLASVFPWFENTYGLPSNYFYAISDATYMNATDYSSVDSIISTLAASEATAITSATDFSTLATYYGLKTVAYEGGPALSGTGAAGQNALLASRDPRMEALVDQHYINWYQAGGGLAMFYSGPFGTNTPQYQWSMLDLYQAANPTASAKYRGLEDIAQAAPVTPTAGTAISATAVTTLNSSTDTLGQSFLRPNTGEINEWLLNVATAGYYTVTLTTGADVLPTYPSTTGHQPATIEVETTDGTPLGTYQVGENGTFNLGSIALHAGLNTLAIKTLVGDYNPGDVAAYIHEFEATGLTITPTAGPMTINAGGQGFSTAGSWQQWAGYGHSGGLDEEAMAGNGSSKADFTFTGLTAGNYSVLITWPAYANRGTNVPYTIYDGSTPLSSYQINQQISPSGAADSSGTVWQTLATVADSSGTLKVELSNLANGRVEADSVRLVAATGVPVSPPTTPPPTTPPSSTPVQINAGGAGFSTAGTWQQWAGFGHAGNLDEEAMPGNGSSRADYVFTGLANTQYIIQITWPAYQNRASNVPYTIYDGTTALANYTVNQLLSPVGVTDSSGTVWQQLAIMTDSTGTLKVELNNNANGRAEADAVRIIASPGATVTTPPPPTYNPITISAGGAGFSTSGAWQQWAGYGHAGGLDEEAMPGNGSSLADWTFSGLAAGQYMVQIIWPPYANRATNAPYTLYDGSNALSTYAINQQAAPTGTADADGTVWQTLGNVSISSGTLKVELSNLANGRVEADAVRIVRIS